MALSTKKSTETMYHGPGWCDRSMFRLGDRYQKAHYCLEYPKFVAPQVTLFNAW
jgi:hypothetical protein